MSRTRTPPPHAARNAEGNEPEKRRAILHAAVRVFAEKGYHGCRIADVARAANVAYGLVYHYFRNKEELLESVFAEQWTILINAIRAIDEGPGTAADKVAAIFGFVFDVYKAAPAAVRVLILEVTRTPQGLRAGSTRETFDRAVHLVADVVRQGQQAGELRAELDPVIAAAGLLGALELAMTGMVIGIVPAGDEAAVDRVKGEVVELVCGGLRRR
ncbi:MULTISPECIES: TetR/AcrR family transcriptional regulator [Anaeromyxobacter]|uniref:TetR/AcrR family transcriptional regulator n=1 Tax=Anaeromyxobacter TaxID=161492 RepID=UPI001F57C87D|nr:MULTISPECIES: TetR/AcrR family transcriptional regulator [unclassified Anaeromyxobacter]